MAVQGTLRVRLFRNGNRNHVQRVKNRSPSPAALLHTTMAQDELEEISGIKPNVYLQDGEEKDISSMTRYGVYSRAPLMQNL